MADQWKILMDDMRDGTIDTQAGADAADLLAGALGKTTDEVLAIADAEIDKEFEGRRGRRRRDRRRGRSGVAESPSRRLEGQGGRGRASRSPRRSSRWTMERRRLRRSPPRSTRWPR